MFYPPVHGPVEGAAIVKGYEYGAGQHLVLEPEELDALRPAQDRALRLERFLEPAQFEPLLFSGRGLHLLPDGPAAAPAYGVLCQALLQSGRWAVGRMVLSGQRQVVLVRPAGTTLVLHVLHYPEWVRANVPDSPGCPARTAEAPVLLPLLAALQQSLASIPEQAGAPSAARTPRATAAPPAPPRTPGVRRKPAAARKRTPRSA